MSDTLNSLVTAPGVVDAVVLSVNTRRRAVRVLSEGLLVERSVRLVRLVVV